MSQEKKRISIERAFQDFATKVQFFHEQFSLMNNMPDLSKSYKLTLSESFKKELVQECLPVLATCQSELEARYRSITPMIVYLRSVLSSVIAQEVGASIISTNADNCELLVVQKIANDAEKITKVLSNCGVLDDSVTELSRAIFFFREYAHACFDVEQEYANLRSYFQVGTALKMGDEKKRMLLGSVDIIISIQNKMAEVFNHYISVVSQSSMERRDFDRAMSAFSDALEEADRLLNNRLESEFPTELKNIVVHALNDIADIAKFCREYIKRIQYASSTLLRTKS